MLVIDDAQFERIALALPGLQRAETAVLRDFRQMAFMARIPKGTEKLNQTAFAEGIKAAEEMVKTLVFEEPPEDHDQV